MARIQLHDDVQSAIVKLADGNPGAAVAMMKIFQVAPEVDPKGGMGGLGPILSLDTLGIYGSRIWMLYKDFCGEDAEKAVFVLRACQMGFITERELNYAIDNRGADLNCPEAARMDSKFPLDAVISMTQEALGRIQ